jgi:hypothetical protein
MRRPRAGRPASILLAALLLSGCGEREKLQGQVVPLEQVPAKALEAARKTLEGYRPTSAYKEVEDGRESFEIQARNAQGKVRDVKVTAEGKVLEVD